MALKAIKNTTEIKGARAAHVRDGRAVARFLAWLDRAAATGTLDEIEAVRRLEGFRRAKKQLREISFDTISGSGPNGAIVHYRVSEATNRKLRRRAVPARQRRAVSRRHHRHDAHRRHRHADGRDARALHAGAQGAHRHRHGALPQGHARHRPRPVRAPRAVAAGLDYDHGTGHGVGSYLSVHEGPQSISRAGMAVLEPGMICSNEPGYYKEGAYGIRIENLVLVTELTEAPGGDREMMGFETLTLAPIDRRLIVKDMLTADERNGSTTITRAWRRRSAPTSTRTPAPGSGTPPRRFSAGTQSSCEQRQLTWTRDARHRQAWNRASPHLTLDPG